MALNSQAIRRFYSAHGDKLRFLVVGGWNMAFAYALFAALLYAFQPLLQSFEMSQSGVTQWAGRHYYLIISWAAWALSVPQSAVALKYLVFHSKGRTLFEMLRAYLVYLPLQVLSAGTLWLLAGPISLHPLVAQLITLGMNAVLSYIGNKRITFRQHRSRPS